MSRATLNEKVWYRGLKVIFVIGFLVIQAFSCFVVANAITSEGISFVRCDNGKEFENPYFSPDAEEKLKLYKKCDLTSYFLSISEVKGVITDEKLKQLKSSISEMQKNGSLEAEMKLIVDDFKRQYADRTPASNTVKSYTTEELTKIWGHDVSDSFKVERTNSYWVSNFTTQYKDKYSGSEKFLWYLGFFIVISMLFWLIARIFFYILCGEKILDIQRLARTK